MQDQSQPTTPRLSVVVVIFGGRAALPRCLDALSNQTGVDDIEIIVPCDKRITDLDALRQQYPKAEFLPVEGERVYAELRAIGIKHSHAPIVAITEAQCLPDPTWASQILEAHRLPHPAIGGVVDKESGTAVSWAMYLCDYSRYTPPVQEGATDYLTDCNVSYKRAEIDAIADVWPVEFHETSVHWTLMDKGKKLWLSPNIVARHARVLSLGEAIADRYAFGRLFAATRVEAVSPLKRWVYAAASCVLPVLIVWRASANTMRKGRHRPQLAKALPAMILVASVWTIGEFLGYVTGRAGKSLTPSNPHTSS